MDAMEYQDFIGLIRQKAHEELGYPLEDIKFYPEGYTSEEPSAQRWIRDCNAWFYGGDGDALMGDFLLLEASANEQLASIQRIALRRLYEKARKDGYDAAFAEISKMKKLSEAPVIDQAVLDARGSSDYESIRGQLILRPLNYALHIRDLNGCVYRKVSDFVLVLYQFVGDSNNTLVTSRIRREELERWGMEGREDKVLQDALENTARLFPPTVYDKRTQSEANLLEKEFRKEDVCFWGDRFLLSSSRSTNGAVSLFYPGVIDKLMKIMGGPFQAVFMNVNDVMIFDQKDGRAAQYASIAKDSTRMGEMLSGKVYLCDGKTLNPGIILKIYEDENGQHRGEIV